MKPVKKTGKYMNQVRVRIAPSPTGDPHVGTAYIALFNYVFAKHNNGKFLLRIEDTDQVRSTKESEEQIFAALKWLGLNYDEGPDVGGDFGPYRQSERTEIYKEYADKLIESGMAYYCFCTAERLEELREQQKESKENIGYDGYCKNLTKEEVEEKLKSGIPYVIRLKMPTEGNTVVKDVLRGEVVFENDKIDDQILLKSDGFPTYHLANVVDDHLMGISHVIRAEEWIASTPKHIQLYQAFGWEEPVWIHMPLLRNSDRTKISKRKNPVSLNYYTEKGYLKEAIINFLALMGWSIGGEKEIFGIEEMIEKFNFDKVSLGGPIFDLKKLGWINNQYIKNYDLDCIVSLALPYFEKEGMIDSNIREDKKNFEKLVKIVSLARESSETLSDMPKKSEIYYNDEVVFPVATEDMNKKDRKSVEKINEVISADEGKKAIKLFIELVEQAEEDITEDKAKEILNKILEITGEGPGKVLMPIRIVLTGKTSGPDVYIVMSVIGKERVLKRVNDTIKKYNIL